MLNKILPRPIVCLFFALIIDAILPTPSIIAQWQHKKTRDIKSSIAENRLSEQLISYAYQTAIVGQDTVTVRQQSFSRNGSPMNNGSLFTTSKTDDTFTGHTLSTHYGNQGDETDNAYDALGRPLSIHFIARNQPSETKTFQYELNRYGMSVKMTTPTGVVTTTHFNALGQKRNEIDNLHTAPLSSITYNDLGQATCQTTIQGIQTCTDFDANGRKRRVTKQNAEGDSIEQTITYDDVAATVTTHKKATLATGEFELGVTHKHVLNDQKKAISDSIIGANSSLTHQQTYDNFTQVIGQSMNLGSNAAAVSTRTYDALGHIATVTIAANSPKETSLHINLSSDLNNKLLSKSLATTNTPDEKTTRYQYTYDGLGNLQTEQRYIDNQGHRINESYDDKNNGYLVNMTDWAGQHFTTTYADILGKKLAISKTVPQKDGVTTAHTNYFNYDPASGKLTDIGVDSNTPEIHYQYSANGSIKKIQYADGATITYSYYGYNSDQIHPPKPVDIDRLACKTDAAGLTTHYFYGGFGQITAAIAYDKNGQVAKTTKYYSPLGELKQSDRDGKVGVAIDKLTYTYNDLKQIAAINRESFIAETTVETELDYQYDKRGNISKKTITYPVNATTDTTCYTYDNLNHLNTVNEIDNSGPISDHRQQGKKYFYDVNGNVIAIEPILYHSFRRAILPISSAPATQYQYNNLDELINAKGKALTYDDNNGNSGDGNLVTDTMGNNYTYTTDNHLSSYTPAGDKQHATSYTYYANGLRQGKTRNNINLTFYYADGKLSNAQQKNGNDDQVFSAYFRDGQVQARFLVKNGVVIHSDFFNHDLRGSTISGVNLNADGNVTSDIYKYNADGSVRVAPIINSKQLSIRYNPMQFGQYTDQESGNQYHQARYVTHFSGVARFISRDFGCQLMNLYQVDNGNVVNNCDPNGHMPRRGFFKKLTKSDFSANVTTIEEAAEGVAEALEIGDVALVIPLVEGLTEGGAAEEGEGRALILSHRESNILGFSIPEITNELQLNYAATVTIHEQFPPPIANLVFQYADADMTYHTDVFSLPNKSLPLNRLTRRIEDFKDLFPLSDIPGERQYTYNAVVYLQRVNQRVNRGHRLLHRFVSDSISALNDFKWQLSALYRYAQLNGIPQDFILQAIPDLKLFL